MNLPVSSRRVSRRRSLASSVRETAYSARDAIQASVISTMVLRDRLRSGVAYNPLSARMVQDPYPGYAALRTRAPVHRSWLLKGWVFARYADVDAILRDHRHFGNDPRKGTLTRRHLAMLPPSEYTLLFLDPPDHTRLRALVGKAFSTQAINALEPLVRRTMSGLLDSIGDPTGFDLMEAVARPLPVIVIAEMLGVPARDRARFNEWSARRGRLLEPTISRRERKAGGVASREFDAYFRPVIEERRAAPRQDIVSTLAAAQAEGTQLSDREVLNMLRLLLSAGTETTSNLIGNGVLALLRHPDQLQRLREDPRLIPSAVEELIRYDSPTQTNFRRVLADCEVNGFPVRKRDNIVLLLGAANRDPAAFENPDCLDVGRSQGSHISFGRGIHYCLGAPLARLEGRIALEMLLSRFSSIRLSGKAPRFRKGVVLRGLQSLPLSCIRA